MHLFFVSFAGFGAGEPQTTGQTDSDSLGESLGPHSFQLAFFAGLELLFPLLYASFNALPRREFRLGPVFESEALGE